MSPLRLTHVDGATLKRMLTTAADVLERQKDQVNALNVFPVPDGDTGSNMSATMMAAIDEVNRASERTVGQVAQAVAQGSLMGARGNSGVILSQLFRGFARCLEGKRELDAQDFARALQEGVDTAYKAVMKPVEGTILTVARESARAAAQACRRGETDVRRLIELTYQQAEGSLSRTPELLPVLKKAGVVDSGGKGYCCILAGYLVALQEGARPGAVQAPVGDGDAAAVAPARGGRDHSPATRIAFRVDEEISAIHFPYDTELFIRGQSIDQEGLRQGLSSLGDSVLVVGDARLTKVHIHTDQPGRVLDLCLGQGELLNINILNMREQHEDVRAQAGEIAPAPPVEAAAAFPAPPSLAATAQVETVASAVVAVGAGPGLDQIFRSLGAATVVQGGQTMNPSTEDLLRAVESCPAPVVFVLPNNKNIILAAQQAADLVSGKEVRVVPTRTIPQGIAALVAWQPDLEPARADRAMNRAAEGVQTGEITYAVRDTVFGELQISEGDILGLWNGQISHTGADPEQVLQDLLAAMIANKGGEVVTIYWGEGVAETAAACLADQLRQLYPSHEIDVQYGGQPLYFYLFSLE